ncbi:hypothetical protein TIFTF001_013491 [Ficus carica]|uniref:Uncharacterized protein n=1 Tax=Ficus carica TaxID=3494 RepID=A0AA88A3L5_FICCA|nr:hypothetical protein TIFTF001_013491 [Ficus carica]
MENAVPMTSEVASPAQKPKSRVVCPPTAPPLLTSPAPTEPGPILVPPEEIEETEEQSQKNKRMEKKTTQCCILLVAYNTFYHIY